MVQISVQSTRQVYFFTECQKDPGRIYIAHIFLGTIQGFQCSSLHLHHFSIACGHGECVKEEAFGGAANQQTFQILRMSDMSDVPSIFWASYSWCSWWTASDSGRWHVGGDTEDDCKPNWGRCKIFQTILSRAKLASKCSRTQVQWSRSKYCLFLQTNMLLRPILQASLSGRNKYIILAHPSMDHIKQLNCYFLRAHLVPTFSHCMLMYVGAGQIQSSSFLNQWQRGVAGYSQATSMIPFLRTFSGILLIWQPLWSC